jgi:hypothetical protein
LADRHDEREPGDWLVRNIRALADSAKMTTSIALLAGFLLVSLAKTGMDWFYARFDLTPAEVGLNQTSILFQTAATAIVVVTGSALVGLAISAAATRVARRGHRLPAGPPSFRSLINEPRVVKSAALVALILLVGYFAWGLETAQQSIARIRSGDSTSSQVFAHGEIVAWCVEVWWNNPRLNEVFGGPPARRLVFFGQASGIAVFYDAKTRHTIRVSVSDVVTRSC